MSADPSFLPAGLGSPTMDAGATGAAIVFVDRDLKAGPATTAFLEPVREHLARAAEADGFKGKALSALDLLAPPGLTVGRLVVVGLGTSEEIGRTDWVKAGGHAMGRLPSSAREVSVLLEGPDGPLAPEQAADVALGMRLRAYAFERYKTKRKDKDGEAEEAGQDNGREAGKDAKGPAIRLVAADEGALGPALARSLALAEGVVLARNLVNEPPNVLYPQAFAARLGELKELGVEVEVMDEDAMAALGMRALLGVGQGSEHSSRVVVMRWNGGAPDAQPVAFVGKGVTFDTGGISLKPGAGMEDMKGDMGGAACVAGLMHALAARRARANVIGAVGLVENMPDGKAQRPGDIVTSLSGQTIEIINTDAEGRLVLADVLWHVAHRYKPRFMVDLATLTGAIMVALAQEYAGLFSNDDELAARLFEAGTRTGERVWRMPLGPEYDKMIDSKFADMKNTGGRHGGSITAAQFLQRFVHDTPWAHLDIAGTAIGSPSTETNRSWGSGWGVRLLDRLVADHYEG